jgi:transcriptional/translational regulatory protein YebC/TACO1
MAPVKFMFERYGRVSVSIAKSDEAAVVNKILDIGIERGASEVKQLEESDAEAPLTMEVINQSN